MALHAHSPLPFRASLHEQHPFTLVWTPGKDYVAGTSFQIRLGSLRAFVDWRFVEWHVAAGDIIYRWPVEFDVSQMRKNPDRILVEVHLQYGARKGEQIKIGAWAIPSHWAGVNAELSVWLRDSVGKRGMIDENAVAEREAGSACTLVTEAGPVERFLVLSRPAPIGDGLARTVLLPTDRFGNPASFREDLTVALRYGQQERKVAVRGRTTVDLPADDAATCVTARVPLSGLAADEAVRNGRREGGEYVVDGNPVLPAAVGGLRPVFGEIHWHTDISGDGTRPIGDAVEAARDAYNLDFVAPADHNPNESAWRRTVSALEQANDEGSFATFFGWEASSDRGHENLYFETPDHPLVCGGSAGYSGTRPAEFPQDLGDLPPYIRIPHHTNAVAETRNVETDIPYWHPYPFNKPQDEVRLLEIMQARGNQERNSYSDIWRGWHQRHGSSAQDALRAGYRVGFTGGTDNHCGWPGRSFAAMEGDAYTQPPHTTMLTGAWVHAVDRSSVFEGLYSRHTWAVCDTRAVVRFSVNGVLMGGEVTVPKGEPLVARVEIWAEDALATVDIVSDGEVVWSRSFPCEHVLEEISLGEAAAGAHFYLRGLLRNGGIFYASPVFVTV